MKRLKCYTLAGIIFVSIIGTLSHFLYQLSGNNALVGLFTPVGESTWEHMKLLFFPMLLYSLWMSGKLKEEYPGVKSGIVCQSLKMSAIWRREAVESFAMAAIQKIANHCAVS